MIVLDTHIWARWVGVRPSLSPAHYSYIQSEMAEGLGVCAISCWEIALLAAGKKNPLTEPVDRWLNRALLPPIVLLPLTPEVAVESTRLPGKFHKDPADRIIVATARVFNCPLVTLDRLILAYPHVRLAP